MENKMDEIKLLFWLTKFYTGINRIKDVLDKKGINRKGLFRNL